MNDRFWGLLTVVAAVLGLAGVAEAAPPVLIAPDRASGTYELNERVTWTVSVDPAAGVPAGGTGYQVKAGGLTETATGLLEFQNGRATVSATRTTPGTLLLIVTLPNPGGKDPILNYGGAVFAPDAIRESQPPPADFDAFWANNLQELADVAAEPVWTAIDVGEPGIEYFQVTMNNVRGAKIYGQLARPKGKSNLPALLKVQWAGVYGLDRSWVLGPARDGWLTFNISAHDLPIDKTPAFYEEQQAGPLNDYPGIGNDDKSTSYFRRMFLSCYRGAEFLTQQPEWNGITLVASGGSQGGYQAFVTAGLHPKVTAFAANVPAGCDHTGEAAGRAAGWPQWASRTWLGRDREKMLEASRYYDAQNFARRTEAEALVGIGLIDTACPAEGIFATVNQLRNTKTVVVMPTADHGGVHDAYYGAEWKLLNEMKQRGAGR